MIPLFQPLPQTFQCRGPIPVLAPFLPGSDHNSGGEMGEPNSRLGPVLVLASLSTGREGFHPTLGKKLLVSFGDGEGIRSVV
jgi:hypothetical protein